jgi:hypothetical protein
LKSVLKMNMNKISIKTTTELLRLRGILDQIGQASWSFSVLNKQYPVGALTEEQARELLVSYKELINRVTSCLENEYEDDGVGKRP